MGRQEFRSVGIVVLGLALLLTFSAVVAQEATETPPDATAEAVPTLPEVTETAPETTSSAQSQQPFLGVSIAAAETGAQVMSVAPDSPAAQAGVQENDVITSFDGEAVTADSLAAVVRDHQVGDTVTLTVLRGAESLDLTVTLAARPESGAPVQSETTAQPATMPYIGVSLSDENNAVTVQEVAAGSPAENAGIQVGDVIAKVGDADVTNAADVVRAVRSAQPGDTLTLQVTRGSEDVTVDVTVGETSAQSMMNRGANRGMPGMRGMMNGNAFSFDGKTWTIEELNENSALYEAGLRAGDQITAINGETDLTPQALMKSLMGKSDQSIQVTVDRDGQSQTLDVPVSALHELMLGGFGGFPFGSDENGGMGFPFEFGQRMSGVRLGVQVVNLDETTAKEHDLTVTEGALVTAVEPGSAAEKAGLQVDDVITAVDGDNVTARRPLAVRLYGWKAGDEITLTVLRDGQSMELTATLEAVQMGNGQSPLQLFFGNGSQDRNGFNFQLPLPNIEQPQTEQSLPTT